MTRSRGAGHAFTLIELLIVVAIISILASIAVPNFTEAQVRAKVARIQADMRTLLTGLESYMVDHNAYPERYTSLEVLPRLSTKEAQIGRLTTPIQYLGSLPRDIFDTKVKPPNNGIDYFDPRQTKQFLAPRYEKMMTEWDTVPDFGWLLVSVGPDTVIGAQSNNYLDYPDQGKAMRTLYVTYDPTNGAVSYGNIFRFRTDRSPFQILYPGEVK